MSMASRRGARRTNANTRFAFEMGVKKGRMKRLAKSTQKRERANVGICVKVKSWAGGGNNL